MSTHRPELNFRFSTLDDASHLTQWLTDPEIIRWFPMMDAREIEDAVRIWVGYSRIEATLTAEWNGGACGMAVAYIQPFKKLAHTCLFAIIIKKEYRGKGIGRELLTRLMGHVRAKFQVEILHLEVYEGNPAQKLYERMGFKEFGRQNRFIKENGRYIAKIMMEKSLIE